MTKLHAITNDTECRNWIILFAALCTLTAALALFFAWKETIRWREMSLPLLCGTVALAGAVVLHAWRTGSGKNALLFFLLAAGIPLAAEYAGIRWGIPFGARFLYHPNLRPRLFCFVPLFIPLAWAVLAYFPVVLLRHWEPEPSRLPGSRLQKAVAAAAMLCVADLSLDPLAVAVAAWTWERPGVYFGIPASNYLGWLLVALAIYGSFFALERPAAARHPLIVFRYDQRLVAVGLFLTGVAHLALLRHVPGGAWIMLITIVTGAPGLLFWAKRRHAGLPVPDARQPPEAGSEKVRPERRS